MKAVASIFLFVGLLSGTLFAGGKSSSAAVDSGASFDFGTDNSKPPEWGVALAVRYAKIPFAAKDESATDIFPLFYYEGERFFLRGDYGGVKLYEEDRFGVNAIARYRFFDVPEEYEEEVRGGAIDVGLQGYWKLDKESRVELDLLSDPRGRFHTEVRLAGDYRRNKWRLFPELELRLTGSEYNSHYYGVDRTDLNEGIEARARLKARRRVYSSLHLESRIEAGWLGGEAKESAAIEDEFEWEVYLGLGIFDEQEGEVKELNAKPYWRIAQGWGTSSDFQNIIFGEHETEDGADVRSTSIFYGHPLSDTIFGAPIEMYLTGGVVYHYASNVQGASFEWVLGFKGYYTFPTPWRVRLGIAEGISYADSLTFYEDTELEEKGYRQSQLLNYLDLTLDMNVGDVFKSDKLDPLWVGVGIHHRSGIYESSSAFGSISGGANFSNIYLQWHGDF